MASAVDRVQLRLQEAMDQGNQASLGQAIDASKGVNGLKQLRRSAKARLKQLSADQNRNMIGSHMPPEEPLTWRTSEQSGRYRAVAHLPTSIIGWVIGHKGCNARMLKQQTGTELWVDVPGQCVIIESRAVQEVEGGMEAVNGFVKTAPTFIAKVQAGGGGGITQTVQCPVHLLPSIQRLSRKIQAESGANCVFANCKMSTFCVTGDRKNVENAVAMLKRLIAEGHSEPPPPPNANSIGNGNGNVVDGIPGGPVGLVNGNETVNGNGTVNGTVHGTVNGNMNGNVNANVNGSVNGNVNGHGGDRRGLGPSGMRGVGMGVGVGAGAVGVGELSHRMGRVESDMSRSDGSPPTAPCSPETASAANAWGNGAPSQLRTSWNVHQPEPPPPPSLIAMNTLPPPGVVPGVMMPVQHPPHLPAHYPASAPATPGGTAVAPFQGPSAAGGRGVGAGNGGGGSGGSVGVGGGGPSSDLSFFSFGVSGVNVNVSAPAPGGAPVVRASTAPTPGVSGGGGGGGSGGSAGLGGGGGSILPGLGFLEESSGAGSRMGFEHDYVDDERRASSCGSGEFGSGEAPGFPQHSRRPGSVGSLGVGGGSGGGGVAGVGGGEGGGGCPLEGNIEDLLEELGLTKYVPVFRSAEVDLSTLCIMSEQDFRELGILKGPRVKIMHHIGSR